MKNVECRDLTPEEDAKLRASVDADGRALMMSDPRVFADHIVTTAGEYREHTESGMINLILRSGPQSVGTSTCGYMLGVINDAVMTLVARCDHCVVVNNGTHYLVYFSNGYEIIPNHISFACELDPSDGSIILEES